jgi:hypothetical protein
MLASTIPTGSGRIPSSSEKKAEKKVTFNGRLRDELLDRELFLSLPEARVVLDQWRMDYNHRRPHGGLKCMTPAAFVAGLDDTASGAVPAASRGVSPVGASPLPPTHHADCSPTLS